MASEIKVDTVSEKTSANGVTIDGVNIKDSKIVTANSVDSDVYVDGSIDTAHLAADAITGAKIADDAINSEHYTDGSIDTAHIADGQITVGKLATAVFTGATDIGAAIVDADLFLMDDGAGGTIRKTTASRLKTYAAFNADAAQVFNESSADVDFRVESNGNDHMLFVDGGNDHVMIGTSSDLGGVFGVNGDQESQGNLKLKHTGAAHRILRLDGNTGTGGDSIGDIEFMWDGNIDAKISAKAHTDTTNKDEASIYIFTASGGTLANGVRFQYNQTNCFSNNDSFAASYLIDVNGTGTIMRLNRADDGSMVLFQSAGNTEGNIAISGSTCTYTTFTGAHWSQLADLSTPTILKGTVMESIAALCDWYVVEITRKKDSSNENEIIKVQHILQAGQSVGDTITVTYEDIEYSGVIVKETNTQLTKVKVSDTEDSKAVYGVHQVWAADAQDEGDMNVVGLGTFVVRVHKDETVAIGDLLSSKGDGTAKVQADDIMRSKTIAKVTSTIKQQTYDDDSYLVPCTLHCG